MQQAERCCQQCYTYGGNQTYRGASKHTAGHPNIWVVSNIWGHPNIWVVSKDGGNANIQGATQTYEGIQTYRVHPHIWGQPNIQGGIQTYSRASKYMGGVQTYGWSPNMGGMQTYRGCPNIWGIQTYRVHPHIWGHMDTPLV